MSKTEKKLTNFVWFLLKIFPLLYIILFAFCNSGNIEGTTESAFFTMATSVLNYCIFEPIFTILLQISYNLVGSIPDGAFILAVLAFISYWVFVELMYFLYFFFTFLFRLMRNWMENWG